MSTEYEASLKRIEASGVKVHRVLTPLEEELLAVLRKLRREYFIDDGREMSRLAAEGLIDAAIAKADGKA